MTAAFLSSAPLLTFYSKPNTTAIASPGLWLSAWMGGYSEPVDKGWGLGVWWGVRPGSAQCCGFLQGSISQPCGPWR